MKNLDQTEWPDTIYINKDVKSSKRDEHLGFNLNKLKSFSQTGSLDATMYVNGDIKSSSVNDKSFSLSLNKLKNSHQTESPDATIYVNDDVNSS